jgi:amino-acid N-acetyltransferase
VIACGGEVIADGRFVALSHDLNLLAALGVRIVLAFGTRTQIDALLKARKHRTRYRNGVRVTDAVALKCVKEAIGLVRADIEASLSTGLPNSPMAGADIRVASGNFVTAKPLGVIDGVDMLHTGEVRKVDAIGIRSALDTGAIVLLPPLGYSPTGEMFNITVENVAARAAMALKADKLLFLVDTPGVERARGGLIRELPLAEGERLLRRERRHDARTAASALESGRGVSALAYRTRSGMQDAARPARTLVRETPAEPSSASPQGRGQRRVPADAGMSLGSKVAEDIHLFLPHALAACRGGVERVHLVNRHLDGALLLELFTREGVGTMVVRHALDHLRSATIEDVGGVLALIAPLEADGSLVKRGRELLEMEIDRFSLIEHDGLIVGCAALYPYPQAKAGELACLAVHPDYRDAGQGACLLEATEAKARAAGMDRLFVLTTRTAHWFIEHGFSEAGVDALPADKQAMYNWQRRSKILVKRL